MSPSAIRDSFLELVRGRYLRRCAAVAAPSERPPEEGPPPPPVEGVPQLQQPEEERAFLPPLQLDMKAVHRAVEGRPGQPPPDPVRWRVNFSRLDEEYRSAHCSPADSASRLAPAECLAIDPGQTRHLLLPFQKKYIEAFLVPMGISGVFLLFVTITEK